MSFDSFDAAGSGTQDDPYRGIVELNSLSDMYVEVGTQLKITYSVGLGFTRLVDPSDDIGLVMTTGGSALGGDTVLEGTVDAVGVVTVLLDPGWGPSYYSIYAVAPSVELSFISSPLDAQITYVGATS